ncbi:hypothetical protein Tco_0416883, partial [Tanacetum coccineum]
GVNIMLVSPRGRNFARSRGALLVERLLDACGSVSDGMSVQTGLWDEDNASWTESFRVSPSRYDKSLSSHVSM